MDLSTCVSKLHIPVSEDRINDQFFGPLIRENNGFLGMKRSRKYILSSELPFIFRYLLFCLLDKTRYALFLEKEVAANG